MNPIKPCNRPMKTTAMQSHWLVLRRPIGSHCWTHEGPPWTKLTHAKNKALEMRRQYRDSDVAIVEFPLPDKPRIGKRTKTILAYLWQ